MIQNINCIILCAGTGSRMNSEQINKVCFPIMDKPAVVRVIENLKECGVSRFIVVVGKMAESVMECVSNIKGVTFAFQKEQTGTGNAAMCGLKVLNDFDIDGPVLIAMGDKLIDKNVFFDLINDFENKKTDVSLIIQPSSFNLSGGKIVFEKEKVVGIVENSDLLLAQIYEYLMMGVSDLELIYDTLKLSNSQREKLSKKVRITKDLNDYKEKSYLYINGVKYTPGEVLSSGYVNCATYLFKREMLNKSLIEVKSDNAQNEIYFTDTVAYIAKYGNVSAVKVDDRKLIHTFNTQEELNNINNYFKEFSNEQA